jgi:hypothetical protein
MAVFSQVPTQVASGFGGRRLKAIFTIWDNLLRLLGCVFDVLIERLSFVYSV